MYEPNIEYLAGYFDGDGCITMRARPGTRSYRLKIEVKTGCRPILEVFQRCYGGSLAPIPSASTNKLLHRWELSSLQACQVFLLAMQPLVIEKRLQVDAALAWLDHRLTFSVRGSNRADHALARQTYETLKRLKATVP